jgi:hypothetical protein
MAKTRVFISFDYDHDLDLKTLLVGQAKHSDSPFEIADFSVKDHLPGNWKDKVRTRIKGVDQVCVLCGEQTHNAAGVSAELTIAKEERVTYFLLAGRADGANTKPTAASSTDKIYKWTWDNLKVLLNGGR